MSRTVDNGELTFKVDGESAEIDVRGDAAGNPFDPRNTATSVDEPLPAPGVLNAQHGQTN